MTHLPSLFQQAYDFGAALGSQGAVADSSWLHVGSHHGLFSSFASEVDGAERDISLKLWSFLSEDPSLLSPKRPQNFSGELGFPRPRIFRVCDPDSYRRLRPSQIPQVPVCSKQSWKSIYPKAALAPRKRRAVRPKAGGLRI